MWGPPEKTKHENRVILPTKPINQPSNRDRTKHKLLGGVIKKDHTCGKWSNGCVHFIKLQNKQWSCAVVWKIVDNTVSTAGFLLTSMQKCWMYARWIWNQNNKKYDYCFLITISTYYAIYDAIQDIFTILQHDIAYSNIAV